MNLSSTGRLVALRTKAEVQAHLSTIDAYIVNVPLRSANTLLRTLERVLPEQHDVNLQHLRRLVRPEFLPAHLKKIDFDRGFCQGDLVDDQSSNSDCKTPVEGSQGFTATDTNETNSSSEPQNLCLLICASSTISHTSLLALLSSHPPFSDTASKPPLLTIPVPLFPPTSSDQAKTWSLGYWPTVYKKNNPFGPHPSILSRAEASIFPSTRKWMQLAQRAAAEASQRSLGAPFGAVVVNPAAHGSSAAVAVAGDARWATCAEIDDPQHQRSGNGNAMAHAVMRAIGLVARKRRALLSHDGLTTPPVDPGAEEDNATSFADTPLTPTEAAVFSQDSLAKCGYLCLDLEMYVTHEPCVMCSMALLHSRFGKVVFGEQMMRTGGITAEVDGSDSAKGGLGYGLFWRPELNWKFLAWRWEGNGLEEGKEEEEYFLVEEVHV
ncbi:tRNA-specific adenosine deaminase subunit tad3 [Loxospora ochrophaea]|nr:tRNA-specific adenosine deaminase subunit tad3 [Loxospora ochrophaea]